MGCTSSVEECACSACSVQASVTDTRNAPRVRQLAKPAGVRVVADGTGWVPGAAGSATNVTLPGNNGRSCGAPPAGSTTVNDTVIALPAPSTPSSILRLPGTTRA